MPLPNEHSLPCESQSQSEETQAPTLQAPEKKRNRFNKTQTSVLEQYFTQDHSPSAARRKEISELIRCSTRQTQVWFQNRRNKEKRNSRICRPSRQGVIPSVKQPPDLCRAIQNDFAMLILEDDMSIYTIPCTTLTIGEWNQVNRQNQQDLIAWVCEEKRCFTWFIHSQGYSFKMQVSFDDVKEARFSNAGPAEALLTLELVRPPTFYMKQNFQRQEGVPPPCWRLCDDWTENKAATRRLCHVLRGSVLPLAYVHDYVRQNATPAFSHISTYSIPTEDYFSPYPNSASTTPTHLSPILGNPLHPHEFGAWDSVSTTQRQTPLYDAKPLPNAHQGRNRPRAGVVYMDQYENICLEHDKMEPSGADTKVSLRCLAPQPATSCSENEFVQFRSLTGASGNGYDHHHSFSCFSTFPSVPGVSQGGNFLDSQPHSTD